MSTIRRARSRTSARRISELHQARTPPTDPIAGRAAAAPMPDAPIEPSPPEDIDFDIVYIRD